MPAGKITHIYRLSTCVQKSTETLRHKNPIVQVIFFHEIAHQYVSLRARLNL